MNIEFTEIELDMLCEAFNMGASKSAKALTELTSQNAELAIPNVKELRVTDLYEVLCFEPHENITSIRLPFSKEIEGHAELVMSKDHANELVELCLPADIPEESMKEVKKEMLQEIANILLHACFGTLSNMLGFETDLHVPVVTEQEACDGLHGVDGMEDKTQALAVNASLTLEHSNIESFIVLYFNDTSMGKIKQYLETFMVKAGIAAKATPPGGPTIH